MESLQPPVAAIDGVSHAAEARDAWQLRNGTAVMLRAVQPEDGERIQALVQDLSTQSRSRRFFHPIRELAPDVLDRFMVADPMHAMTLLAVVRHKGAQIAVGMAQYAADPYPQRCEFAVVVSDAWQRSGIATRLIRNLICIARAAGIERFEGDVLADNEPMRQLLTGMEFTIGSHPDDASLMRAEKQLAASARKCSELAVLALRARASQRSALV